MKTTNFFTGGGQPMTRVRYERTAKGREYKMNRQAVDTLSRMLVNALVRLPEKSCQSVLAEIFEMLPREVTRQRQCVERNNRYVD
jgi:hypothetical protein